MTKWATKDIVMKKKHLSPPQTIEGELITSDTPWDSFIRWGACECERWDSRVWGEPPKRADESIVNYSSYNGAKCEMSRSIQYNLSTLTPTCFNSKACTHQTQRLQLCDQTYIIVCILFLFSLSTMWCSFLVKNKRIQTKQEDFIKMWIDMLLCSRVVVHYRDALEEKQPHGY